LARRFAPFSFSLLLITIRALQLTSNCCVGLSTCCLMMLVLAPIRTQARLRCWRLEIRYSLLNSVVLHFPSGSQQAWLKAFQEALHEAAELEKDPAVEPVHVMQVGALPVMACACADLLIIHSRVRLTLACFCCCIVVWHEL
jgi:hypothetical protein